MTKTATRTGSVSAKANKTDAVYQTFTVQEVDGSIYYYNRSIGDWCSIPSDWVSKIVWD